MKTLDEYTKETEKIVDQVNREGKHDSTWIYYLMVVVGIIVTGTLTYSLTRRGMSQSPLWKLWIDVAAALPVFLLEGSALALMYARHKLFRSEDQRALGHLASKVIWVVLIVSAIAEFATGFSGSGNTPALLRFYASYILPLAIVCVPVLWKTLYDRHPASQIRAAVLDADAAFRQGLLLVQQEQNNQIIDEFRAAIRSQQVKQARVDLFTKSAIKHAEAISGFIEEDSQPSSPAPANSPPRRVNGLTDYDPKDIRH